MGSERKRRDTRAQQYQSPTYLLIQARLGATLRKLRRKEGWTQTQAAEKVGVKTSHYCRIETGVLNLTLTSLARLCDAFGVDVKALFDAAAPIAKVKRGRPPKREAPDLASPAEAPPAHRPP